MSNQHVLEIQRENGHRIQYRTIGDYFQIHYYDELNHIQWWYDSKGECQKFHHYIASYKKNGEAVWACDFIHSTVHFIFDRKQYGAKMAGQIKEWLGETINRMKRLKEV